MDQELWEFPLSENINIKTRARKTQKCVEYPIGVEFAVMGFVRKHEEFGEVIRIDNAPHQGKPGTHIHFLDKEPRKEKEVVEHDPDIKNPMQAFDYVEKYLTSRYPMLL